MLKWLVVGVGDIAVKRVIPAILAEPRSSLVGVVTRDPKRAEAYGVPAFADLHAALDNSEALAVYIATPVSLHAEQTMAALGEGRHVLCEKPMAMNYALAVGMNVAAQEAGRVLGIAYYRRMYPKVNRAKQLIADGAIGRPLIAEATSHDWFYPEDGKRAWLIDPKMAGGGPLFDIASHRIDLMNYFFGKPERACGQYSTLVHPIQVEDNATVMIDYESGVRGLIDVRWHSKIARDEFRIRGTEGEIDLTPLNSPHLSFPGGSEEIPPHANLHYPCIQNFVAAVLDGTPLRSSGFSAEVTDWITEQVIASTHPPMPIPRPPFHD
jgi:1,5-anhydro-D-fructose reductase (1,5-anhydro-D-mannitol-forming)